MPKKNTRPFVSKRSPSEIQKLMDKFIGFVKKHPGLRIEQINGRLGTSTKDLSLPVRKLVAAGFLKTQGERRSTTYLPGRKA